MNENWLAGETLSSKAIIGVGSDGDITLFNAEGTTDVVVDLDGYFTAPGASGLLFNTLASPVRLLDTRTSTTDWLAAYECAGIRTGGINGIPTSAEAAALNITDLPTGPNYLSVVQTPGELPRGGPPSPPRESTSPSARKSALGFAPWTQPTTTADVNYTSSDTSSTAKYKATNHRQGSRGTVSNPRCDSFAVAGRPTRRSVRGTR